MLAATGLGFTGLALILNIIGLSIPYWFYDSASALDVTESIYFGLWQLCISASVVAQGSISGCGSFAAQGVSRDLPAVFYATRALELIAMLMTATAVALAAFKLWARKDNRTLLKVAGVIGIIAGILMIIGAIVFVTNDAAKHLLNAELPKLDMTPHAGFALCVVSGCLSIIGSIMFLINRD